MRSFVAIVLAALAVGVAGGAEPEAAPAGAIAFSSLAPRGWDLYIGDAAGKSPRRLTDHAALDYNAAFSPDGAKVAFVSERDGNMELYVVGADGSGLVRLTRDFALDDHPSWSPDGRQLAFVSTRQPSPRPGQAWTAVYVMPADGGAARRISPPDAADYSPAWSPRGDWIAVASGSGVAGGTDLFVMKPDGSGRRQVVANGGWPAFTADGLGLFFHRKHQGKWGVWRVGLDGSGLERVSPDDVEAYTPRTSADGRWLVAAVQRGKHRQIERLELASGRWTPFTHDPADHWNPAIAPDGKQVVYHRSAADTLVPNVELWGTPPGFPFQMLRLAGAFPAFAPDGRRLALTGGNFSRLDVMNVDGSGRKTIHTSRTRSLFSLSWAHEAGLIAFSHGTAFQPPDGTVDIAVLQPHGSNYRQLTDQAGNNAFPSFSPDGKQLVFRSGRDQHKNLYLMNRDGSGLRRLTEGKWTATMADWSPSGDWIAFASDREDNFAIWLIRPDGSGLRKLVGGGGRHNHPHFSPDGQWVVFTSQRAGYSAEEISLPFQFQPYGDLFAIRLDGSGLVRLTHNGFEEGTPAWGRTAVIQPAGDGRKLGEEEY
jgi:Tol biopolymer transport system component